MQRIVVLRALGLGDLICAGPALRALRAGFPEAGITLLGLPWAQEYVARVEVLDNWMGIPGWPGLPEQALNAERVPAFLADMQRQRLDLAVQLQGSGEASNGLVSLLGARLCAGFHRSGAWVPPGQEERFCNWPEQGHESQRLLALCRHLGLPVVDEGLEFPLRETDRQNLLQLCPALADGLPYVCLHAGAQLASRRWPAQRFAAVADALHDAGYRIVLSGSAAEQPLGLRLASMMSAPCVNLVGLTTLWTLGALIASARCLIANDTGVSHIAAALRVPSLIVSSGGDVQRWAPPDPQLNRVLSKPAPCRPCAHPQCPTGHGCAHALSVYEVLAALQHLLELPPLSGGSRPLAEGLDHDATTAHPHLARARQLPLQPLPGAA
ncbi:glycosyltransferase family 9 protein [Mitsuaria sp. WAJ17]|nr:glycosyltransferase family 9 protein [Mitsuaria sp. WAJ17]